MNMAAIYAGIPLTLVMTALWALASCIVTGLCYAASPKRLRVWTAVLLWVCGLAIVLSAAWHCLILGVYAAKGWLFVEGTVKTAVPVMLLSHLSYILFARPQLRAIRMMAADEAMVNLQAKASHPRFVIPVYAAGAASGLNALSTIFSQPVLPGFMEIMQWPALLLIILFIPFAVIRRRYQAMLNCQFLIKPIGERLLTAAASVTLSLLMAGAGVGSAALLERNASLLPEASDMMNHHEVDEGGGVPTALTALHTHDAHHGHANGVEVAALTGDISAPADVRFELTAQKQSVTLTSGAIVEAWTYNGELAPQLRVKQGEMVEVRLVNKDIEKGVTIHWHGYNVPNAMDGVPGMTQNIVRPGEDFTYKFRADQAGTYWFHSHQQASEQVGKGLFGSLLVDPLRETEETDSELVVIQHTWRTSQGQLKAFGNEDQKQFKQVEPGNKIKLRIINTDHQSQKYRLQGTDYRITSIDGMQILEPEPLENQTSFRIASGGRYDVTFTMPDHPVQLLTGGSSGAGGPSILFHTGIPPEHSELGEESREFDLAEYGKPLANDLTSAAAFDREFTMIMGNRLGFYNGQLRFLWTINGKVHPYTPMFAVKEGDKVKTTFVNRSLAEHPIHLHGHHMTVLKKNGREVKAPWQTDTLNVLPGESYEVAFLADNPGMWMDHCHNLDHAATGMILHLMYDHVLPSYEVGMRSGNLPD
ncbi:multicopper oxidase type 3 [Paenibacillus mucilaginosus 3016]|uniref:Multicopper oxidase type 3 n=1 Tax=Paenibacillus mucilaginosus 3016 TaxID=1116391 RepID=H6NCS0_9BACL|nr:multicopper oxidase type 3 [Paenibacillus mucilaginosus 3016]WFA17745.1 multicopper oxidase family protein [Paenibacillus mucilaginosus]